MIEELKAKLSQAGYVARREELLALAGAMSRNGGARVLLLEGPPGTGKTALGEALAKALGWQHVYHLLHSWSSDQDLYRGVNVVAAVAGKPEEVVEPGCLAVAAQQSTARQVVLVLDEVDKAPPRVEALLLDFLQSGRVPTAPGVHLQAHLGNLLVLITSNGTRPLHEALLRRCRRVKMTPLAADLEEKLVTQGVPSTPRGVVTLLVRVANAIRKQGLSCPSLQEIAACAADLQVCESCNDVKKTVTAWLCKSEEEIASAAKAAVAIWGELRARQRQP